MAGPGSGCQGKVRCQSGEQAELPWVSVFTSRHFVAFSALRPETTCFLPSEQNQSSPCTSVVSQPPCLLSFWDMCLPMPSGRLWLWAHCLMRSLLASGVTSSLGQLGFGSSWLLLPPLIVSLLMLLADHVVSCVRAHDSCLDTLSGTDQDRMSCLPVVRTVGRETVRLRSWCLKSLS